MGLNIHCIGPIGLYIHRIGLIGLYIHCIGLFMQLVVMVEEALQFLYGFHCCGL